MSAQPTTYSERAEEGVLSSLMASNAAWSAIEGRLSPDDFYRNDHRLIFKTMAQLAAKGVPLDVVTVSEALGASKWLDEVGGLPHLLAILKNALSGASSASNVGHYAAILRQCSAYRALASAAADIAALAGQPGARSLPEVIEESERLIFTVAERVRQDKPGGDWQTYKAIISKAMERVEAAFYAKGHVTGLPSGFIDLDDLTTGFQPGDLVIVAGRPGMGKTSFAMGLAEHSGINLKLPVAVFSMEMPAEQLGARSLASRSGLNLRKLRTGRLDHAEWSPLTVAVGSLAEANIHVDDSPALSPADVRARLRRLTKDHGQLALVVLDYLQLMRIPGERNRVNEVSEISRSLKAIAKEFQVPVVALSQLNRSLEQRPNKRPVMSDLRDSGGIEQDADLILFVYRDEIYSPDSADKGVAEIIIGKQRNGPLGTVKLRFVGESTRFENLAHDAGLGYGDDYGQF